MCSVFNSCRGRFWSIAKKVVHPALVLLEYFLHRHNGFQFSIRLIERYSICHAFYKMVLYMPLAFHKDKQIMFVTRSLPFCRLFPELSRI